MADYYWKFEVQPGGRKYDPDQPRVPAGDSRGGQWTSGGSMSTGVIPKNRSWSQEEEIERMVKEVDTWEDEARRWGANRALTYPGDVLYLKDGDELVGVANVVTTSVTAESGRYKGIYEATYLGTKRPGYGRKMQDLVKEHVVKKGGRGYYAYFVSDALDFHLATGMKLSGDPGDQVVYWMADWSDSPWN